MSDLQQPNLTFTNVSYGNTETPWDLRPLLYKDGAGTLVKKVADLIKNGSLGPPLLERFDIVKRIHEQITGDLAGGGSRWTAISQIETLRSMFSWADSTGEVISLSTFKTAYLNWTDALKHRVQVVGNMQIKTARNQATRIGLLVDKIFEHRTPIVSLTRLPKSKPRSSSRGIEADKQNLQDTFTFGQTLFDICNALSVETLWGSLPVSIVIRSGKTLVEWSGLPSPENRVWSNPKNSKQRYAATEAKNRREAYEQDRTVRTRSPLVNLRIEAELLIFIAQTGMNRAQAHLIKTGQFQYSSHLDGYQVRRYKQRRAGEVEFEIFSEYRELFQRYLHWRNEVFPDDQDGLLFPLVRNGRSEDHPPTFSKVQTSCKKLGINYISPSKLRNTRVNWLLRRSRDEDLTANMAQHTKETLRQHYAEPNLQVAISEISRYHQLTDPALAPPGPGVCIGYNPKPLVNMPKNATPPDCISGTGCLFCENQRDINSEDHIWSLVSFRHMKSIELARYRPPISGKMALPVQPASIAISQLTAKLEHIQISGPLQAEWVREALAKITEGDYHPFWDGFIKLLETRR